MSVKTRIPKDSNQLYYHVEAKQRVQNRKPTLHHVCSIDTCLVCITEHTRADTILLTRHSIRRIARWRALVDRWRRYAIAAAVTAFPTSILATAVAVCVTAVAAEEASIAVSVAVVAASVTAVASSAAHTTAISAVATTSRMSRLNGE